MGRFVFVTFRRQQNSDRRAVLRTSIANHAGQPPDRMGTRSIAFGVAVSIGVAPKPLLV